MFLDPLDLSRRLRRFVRRAVCDRFGHAWVFRSDHYYCRACRISGHDAYRRRRRAQRFAA
jgi:hypothetical protein